MTLDEARDHIGEHVLYAVPGKAEEGAIVRVGRMFVFVQYVNSTQPQATPPEHLTLVPYGSVQSQAKAPRLLRDDERIQARHLLQVLAERARALRNAMEPRTGVLRVTDESWAREWEGMTRDLAAYTDQVRQDKPAHPYKTGDRSA